MKARFTLAALMLFPSTVLAQGSPTPSIDDPRLQTIVWQSNLSVRLVAFPDASLTLVFHRDEAVKRVLLSDGSAFSALVVNRGEAIEIAPLRENATATMTVETDLRNYEFTVETGEGFAAAYLVRFVAGQNAVGAILADEPASGAVLHNYRIRGDRSVRPDALYDDGERTFIEWQKDRALPAVFGLGPSGVEEIVAGYMREGKFVIDRVYPDLVFRFDKQKSTARRETGSKRK